MKYTTRLKKWMFDYTVQFNGGGRVPQPFEEWQSSVDISSNIYEFQPYTVMNAQVTKYFRYWNIYLGTEILR